MTYNVFGGTLNLLNQSIMRTQPNPYLAAQAVGAIHRTNRKSSLQFIHEIRRFSRTTEASSCTASVQKAIFGSRCCCTELELEFKSTLV